MTKAIPGPAAGPAAGGELAPAPRVPGVRRRATRALVSSAIVSTLVVIAYFVLPLSSALTVGTVLWLAGGLIAVTLLLAWHLWSILRSPYPRIRAVSALATTVPIFLVVFATAYFMMGRTDAADFSEPLSRLDSAYFTVTVFATVGFGDIVPVTPAARAATMVQMIGDIILVGLVAHVIFGAVQRGIRRRDRADASDAEDASR